MNAQETVNGESLASKDKSQGIGVPYPIATIDDIISDAKKIVDEVGTSKPISKDEISRILGKKVNTLVLFYSTIVQYGIFTLIHGKGYLPTELYKKYTQPGFDNDEHKAKLEMFSSPPLYGKIIQHLNSHQLPSDEKRFANILKDEPYKVNPNSAEKAAKIFFENARNLKLLDSHNTLKFSVTSNNPETHVQKTPITLKEQTHEEILFELPIPLPNKRKAYLKYPIDNLTQRDIKVIRKALDFIASSVGEEDLDDETKKE